jgi:CDP-diglyceride synthetase
MEQLNSEREPYFWFTHLSLILGLTLTYTYYTASTYPTFNQNEIQIKENVSVVLVIADAMAAIIGRRYGKPSHIIPGTNNKTWEGFAGFVFTAVILQLGLYQISSWADSTHSFSDVDVWFILLSGVVCGIGELFSGDMDNIATSIAYVSLDFLYQRAIDY